MTGWLADLLNLQHDPARPPTRQILADLANPWTYIIVTQWAMIDASLRVARVVDGTVDRWRNGDDWQ